MLLLAFAVYFFVLFVACFVVVNQGQDALYDEPTPGMGWKVTFGTLILAVMLTWTHSSFATMFTDDFGKTALQGILWFLVFLFVFRFHPWHALGIGLATMLIVTGLATMAVESMLNRRPSNRYETKAIAEPIRRPSFSAPRVAPPGTPAAKK